MPVKQPVEQEAKVIRSTSTVVTTCQVCERDTLSPFLFLGYMPPVNEMPRVGTQPKEQSSYPAQMLSCDQCHLVQLGLAVDKSILFPSEYPYTSSTTKILRENFAELYTEASSLIELTKDDLVVDIGSNDGNLLSNFTQHRVLGITPEEIGKKAIERGIPTIIDYFTPKVAEKIVSEHGQVSIVTATNVFAHIDRVNDVVTSILKILKKDGVFISESHYFPALLETLQYDTIYHEHLRYYSLTSLKYLLDAHGLEIFHAKKIPTHGGSIRVYAARKGEFRVFASVGEILDEERQSITQRDVLIQFSKRVTRSKVELYALLKDLVVQGKRIFGIGAPSRASTLISYVGLDEGIVEAVMEIKGSHKIGKYMPGTLIPVLDETRLYEEQPDYALMFSWHIAEELIPKIKKKGFRGDFIIPLPTPRVVLNR